MFVGLLQRVSQELFEANVPPEFSSISFKILSLLEGCGALYLLLHAHYSEVVTVTDQ